MPNCRKLEMHFIRLAFSFALLKAGNSKAASIAIIAITTNNSIRVKASHRLYVVSRFLIFRVSMYGTEWFCLLESYIAQPTYSLALYLCQDVEREMGQTRETYRQKPSKLTMN